MPLAGWSRDRRPAGERRGRSATIRWSAGEESPEHLTQALHDAESCEVLIEATPWIDVHRAGTLASGSLRYADALYFAAAERHATALLTADTRIERSGKLRPGPCCLADQVTLAGGGDPATSVGS